MIGECCPEEAEEDQGVDSHGGSVDAIRRAQEAVKRLARSWRVKHGFGEETKVDDDQESEEDGKPILESHGGKPIPRRVRVPLLSDTLLRAGAQDLEGSEEDQGWREAMSQCMRHYEQG